LIGFILTIELDWPAFFNPIYRKNCTLTILIDMNNWRIFIKSLLNTVLNQY